MSPAAAAEAEARNPESAGRVWLLRVRWLALAGCAALAGAVELWGAYAVPAKAVFLLLAVSAASNVGLWLWIRTGRALADRGVGSVLLLDILVLTAILALTGGASNPFGSAYLLYVAVGALLLPPAWTLALVVACVAAYSGLFWLGSDGHTAHHDMRLHLMGMWMAFVVVGPVVAYAVTRLRRAIALAEQQLARARAREERADKLSALATLAAGAAHELATPLATISVAARELERRQLEPGVTEDARLIRDEVERCSAILSRLAIDAGAGMGEADQATRVDELVGQVVEAAQGVRVTADSALLQRSARLPRRMLVQALRGLLKNAQQASAGGEEAVELRAHADAGDLVIEIADTGCGMREEVRRRVGEPFFTTKPPGQGMGLGVFFARSLVEQLGGALEIHSQAGLGTLVVVRIPWQEKA